MPKGTSKSKGRSAAAKAKSTKGRTVSKVAKTKAGGKAVRKVARGY